MYNVNCKNNATAPGIACSPILSYFAPKHVHVLVMTLTVMTMIMGAQKYEQRQMTKTMSLHILHILVII